MANQLKRWIPGLAFQTSGMRKLTSKNVKFMWSVDLQQELDGIKAKTRENINFNPIDVNKEIHVDAAQKEVQKRYSTFEFVLSGCAIAKISTCKGQMKLMSTLTQRD